MFDRAEGESFPKVMCQRLNILLECSVSTSPVFWRWNLKGRCPMITPTILLSSLLPSSRTFLVFSPSTLPESTFVVCSVLLVYQNLRCSSRVYYLKQSLKKLNGLRQLRGIVLLAAPERTNSSCFRYPLSVLLLPHCIT